MLAIALMIAPLTVAAPVPNHLMPPRIEYFPTSVGSEWVYCAPNGTSNDEKITVSRVVKKGTEALVTFGAGKAEQVVAVSDKGLRLVKDELGLERSLIAPLLLGKELKVENENFIETRAMVKIEEVTVLAGTYQAIRVDVWLMDKQAARANRCSCSMSWTEWYAPGVGLIKEEVPKLGVVRELKSFRSGVR
jgi:hypothetical protein